MISNPGTYLGFEVGGAHAFCACKILLHAQVAGILAYLVGSCTRHYCGQCIPNDFSKLGNRK